MTSTARESDLENKLRIQKLEHLWLIDEEIEIRCGSGNGTVPQSHSINCRCEELNQKKRKLEAEGKGK